MIKLFKILQILKIFSKKKKLFFLKILGSLGPPWSSSGSATDFEVVDWDW